MQQRRTIRRLPSKDDSDIKKVLDAPVQSESSKSDNSIVKKSADDLHFNVHSNRADRLKVQFIEVYVGRQEFSAATENIDAIIAIYLQASDRLYEIVLVDVEKKVEIKRFYVLEDEINALMRKRYDAMGKIYRRRPCSNTIESSVPSSPKRAHRLPRIDSPQNSSPSQSIRHRSRMSGMNSTTTKRKSEIPVIPSFQKEIVKDPIRDYKLAPGKNKTETSFKYFKMKKQDLESKARERWEIEGKAGDGDDEDHKHDTPTSPGPSAAECDDIIKNDICAKKLKDIGYYTDVIVQCIYCSRKKRQPEFRLLDDMSNHFFTIFDTIPKGIKNTVATFVDCNNLVQTSISKWSFIESNNSDAQKAKQLLNAADELAAQLEVKEEDLSSTQYFYKQDDTLNPNKNRYRLLWQAAYAAVVSSIRQTKGVRTEWQKLLDVAKTTKEREDIMRSHAKEGKFRNLATGSMYLEPGLMTNEEVNVFRETIRLNKLKEAEKNGGNSRRATGRKTRGYAVGIGVF